MVRLKRVELALYPEGTMKKSLMMLSVLALSAVSVVPAFSQQGLTGDVKQQIKEVQDAIKKKGAKWTADEVPVGEAVRAGLAPLFAPVAAWN